MQIQRNSQKTRELQLNRKQTENHLKEKSFV